MSALLENDIFVQMFHVDDYYIYPVGSNIL